MSADNLIGVWERTDGKGWCVRHLFASPLDEDCMHLKHQEQLVDQVNELPYANRVIALTTAHDRAKEESVIEYGVCELVPHTEPCGRCYVCVNDRHIIAEDIEYCTTCNTPLIDWHVRTATGTYCRLCEPKIS